jgi:pyruvate formate lyase activating enzyme
VFFKGCPLHCAWCQNPESIKPEPEMAFYYERCLNCGACAEICPRRAIIIPGSRRINPALCDSCGACETACPSGALRLVGREWSPENLSAEVIKDREFFSESGGGVTLTGGEPLRNHLFLNRLCAILKEQDIHITVETCGHFRWEAVQPLLPMVDLFYFDVKLINGEAHRTYTGVDNRLIIQNLGRLKDHGAIVQPRMPVIPGINDSRDNISATASLLKEYGLGSIHCLPCHHLGIAKSERIGGISKPPEFPQADDSLMESVRKNFYHEGIYATIYSM